MATTATAMEMAGLYTDQLVSSTDLNRHIVEVLNKARKGPVTISTKNNEQFALLKREVVADLIKSFARLGEATRFVRAALDVSQGRVAPPTFEWLSAFHKDELGQLCQEVLHATENAMAGNTEWEEVAAVCHEWHESGLVIQNGILERAVSSEANESVLPDPAHVADIGVSDSLPPIEDVGTNR